MKFSYDYDDLIAIVNTVNRKYDEVVKVERGQSIYGEHFYTKEKYNYAPIINFTIDDNDNWYFDTSINDDRVQTMTWNDFKRELNKINRII